MSLMSGLHKCLWSPSPAFSKQQTSNRLFLFVVLFCFFTWKVIFHLDNVVHVEPESNLHLLSDFYEAGILHSFPGLIFTPVKLETEAQTGPVPRVVTVCEWQSLESIPGWPAYCL